MNTNIRTYVRVFPSLGIDVVSPNQFQILDGNTLLQKQSEKKLTMYPFTCIFTHQFSYNRIVEHMNLVNDTFQGTNQIIMAEVNRQNMQSFLLGTAQEPGFVLALFQNMFNQAVYHGLGDEKEHRRTQKGIKREQHISISIFSTQGTSNKFVDLILGQKLIFYSKKDMDQYKNFYNKEIKDMREFLITLKIGMIRYGQCCQEGDPIVFRITINNYDEIKGQQYQTNFHLIVGELRSPIVKQICKKIQMNLQAVQMKGEDHGSLANYFQKTLKQGRSKFSYIYGIPYRKNVILKSLDTFQFMNKIKGQCLLAKISNVPQNPSLIKYNFDDIQMYLSCLEYEKYIIGPSSNFTHKQLNNIAKMLEKLIQFMHQSLQKWKQYCTLMEEILKNQNNFYEKQRIPISLQIKDSNIKAFLISRIYKLSQNYQIQDHSSLMQKLRVIKNQIFIALKVLTTSASSSSNQGGTKSFQHFLTYYSSFLYHILQNLQKMFAIAYHHLTYFRVDSLSGSINGQIVFDVKFVKELIENIKKQAKRVKQNCDKQEVLIRKIHIPSNYYQNSSFQELNEKKTEKYLLQNSNVNEKQNKLPKVFNDMGLSNSFQMFQYSKNQQKSKYGRKQNKLIYKYKTNINKSCLQQPSKIDPKPFFSPTSEGKKQNAFSLPKLAVIHRKKK